MPTVEQTEFGDWDYADREEDREAERERERERESLGTLWTKDKEIAAWDQPVSWFTRCSNKQNSARFVGRPFLESAPETLKIVENRRRGAETKIGNPWAAHARTLKDKKNQNRFSRCSSKKWWKRTSSQKSTLKVLFWRCLVGLVVIVGFSNASRRDRTQPLRPRCVLRRTERERERERQADRQTDRQTERERENQGKTDCRLRPACVLVQAVFEKTKLCPLFCRLSLKKRRKRWK